jgi:hypothetical protein
VNGNVGMGVALFFFYFPHYIFIIFAAAKLSSFVVDVERSVVVPVDLMNSKSASAIDKLLAV